MAHNRYGFLKRITWPLGWMLIGVFLSSALDPAAGQGSGALRGRVINVDTESGDMDLRLDQPADVAVGQRGQIQTTSGGVEFRVTSIRSKTEVRVHEVRRGDAIKVRRGDPAILFAAPEQIYEQARETFSRIDRMLEEQKIPPPVPQPEITPDFLAEVTGEVLDDYEAWLLQLESETIEVPELPGLPTPVPEKLPVYPNLESSQTLRSGVDYFRTVTASTAENRIGRFIRWNYLETGDLWKDHSISFENEFEANDFFVSDEAELYNRYDLPDGGSWWWRNRSIWRVFLNGQGDPFFFNDLEVRRIRKLSDEWDWQTGAAFQFKREYNAFSDDSYWRGDLSTEWNYFTVDRFFNLSYELNRQVYRSPQRRSSDYLRHDLSLSYYSSGSVWDFDGYARFEFFDSNRPRREGDEYRSFLNGTFSRPLRENWRLRLQTTVEPVFYPVTEDVNTNIIRAEFLPELEYTTESLFLTAGPRVAQVFHFGTVPRDVFLSPNVPRDKSEVDFREAGLQVFLFWTPHDKWRVNFSEDLFYRWFLEGETGGTAFYISDPLVDEDRIGDSLNLFTTVSVDYIWSEDLELTFRLSHTQEVFKTFSDNDNSTLDVGVEVLYRF